MKNIGLTSARRMALTSQLNLPGKQSVRQRLSLLDTITHLSYIQIDTISVVARAHHHTLWTRLPEYHADLLDDLQVNQRTLFEYWGHAASYLPIADYRFYLPKMQTYLNPPTSKWDKKRLESCRHLLKPVLERITKEGPLASKDFEKPEGAKSGAWWEWKPAKLALELLYQRGKLMISSRRNFQKQYDLAERVLGADVNTSYPTDEEFGQFLVRRALRSYGLAREIEIRQHLHFSPKTIVAGALSAMIEAGEVTCLTIGKDKQTIYYSMTSFLERSGGLRQRARQMFILSPFDNLVIQRDRIKRLWGFDYTLECYVPAAKRQYGYFVLPLLWGEIFAGRLDPHVNRKQGIFTVRKLYLEKGFVWDDETFLDALARKLISFARFNGCETISLAKTSPAKIQGRLNRRIRELYKR